ncbi:hypothetical protein MMC30_001886 [Trapelia coarctata]|nr:hypothetical protein [Trapelia coarctata]
MSYTPPYTHSSCPLLSPPKSEPDFLTPGWRAKKSTPRNITENFIRILFWSVVIVAGASLLVAGLVFVYDVVVMAWRDYILGSSHTLEAAGEGLKTGTASVVRRATAKGSAASVGVTMVA